MKQLLISLILLFSTYSKAQTYKGLEQMIEDGDFEDFQAGLIAPDSTHSFDQLMRVELDFGVLDSSEAEFALDENAELTEQLYNFADYGETALMAEVVRQKIQTDQNIGHLEAGFYIGTAAGLACEYGKVPLIEIKNKKIARATCAMIAATVAGIGKEIYDSFYPESHTVDINDALATMAGGAVHIKVLNLKW